MNENQTIDPSFTAIMRVDNLPSKGRRLKIDLNDEQCKAVAKQLKIDELSSLKAELLVTQIKGGLHISGNLFAKLVQKSVISFKPVEQVISEKISRIFLLGKPSDEAAKSPEIFVDLEGDDDLPDFYDEPELDLSELVLETLSLEIDQFPRLKGEKMPVLQDEPQSSPFDILKDMQAKIKKD